MTENQEKVLSFVTAFNKERGMAPTITEIAETVLLSTSTVHYSLQCLEKMGFTQLSPGTARSISLMDTVDRMDVVSLRDEARRTMDDKLSMEQQLVKSSLVMGECMGRIRSALHDFFFKGAALEPMSDELLSIAHEISCLGIMTGSNFELFTRTTHKAATGDLSIEDVA